jgi:hypothetical protein
MCIEVAIIAPRDEPCTLWLEQPSSHDLNARRHETEWDSHAGPPLKCSSRGAMMATFNHALAGCLAVLMSRWRRDFVREALLR